MVGMTYDELSVLKAFSQNHKLPYPLLRDEQIKHVSAFNILNTEYGPDHQGYGIPYPGIIYLDADQIVRAKFADQGYKKRPALKEVYEVLAAQIQTQK